jgi:hypothetical protein
MTNHKINVTIAEACGWTEIGSCDCGFKISGMPPYWAAHKKHIPDYCADLNEMHEAEKVLTFDEWDIYCVHLGDTQPSCAKAPARQRAEAFLRTLGKWDEAQP